MTDLNDNSKALEDIKRFRKTERKLKNNKRHWLFERRHLGRNLLQWLNLYLGLYMVIITLTKYPSLSMGDIFVLVMAGICIGLWVFSGLINKQQEFIEELMESNRKSLYLATIAGEKAGLLTKDEEYEFRF
jgi:hypothetical protein